jgi:hypothetical protein
LASGFEGFEGVDDLGSGFEGLEGFCGEEGELKIKTAGENIKIGVPGLAVFPGAGPVCTGTAGTPPFVVCGTRPIAPEEVRVYMGLKNASMPATQPVHCGWRE